jgi:TfoX/Sxy family transcriptional regulator of competence genes
MATSKARAEEIAGLLSGAGAVRIRSMMGEYLVYLDDVLVGQINEGDLFIKVTAFGESQPLGLPKAQPYPGAKPAFQVPEAKLGDIGWLLEFVRGSRAELARKRA